jgi:serine/threonine protein kinase
MNPNFAPFQLGKYRILARIGEGGFGVVYRAEDTTLGREVAIKVLHPHLNLPDFIAGFQREARLTATLEHPNIVTVHELCEVEGRFFLVMSYLPGGSLKDRLASGALPFAEAAHILEDVCAGLEELHRRGIIHRDVKPANILFNARGQAMLTDLGLAKLVSTSSASSSAGGAGTPFYKAPEIWRGRPPAGPTADVYSLGCILYEMITGSILFYGDTPEEVLTKHLVDGPDLSSFAPAGAPAGLLDLLQKSLARDPKMRPSSAGAFAQSLQGLEPPAAPVKRTAAPTSPLRPRLEPTPEALQPEAVLRQQPVLQPGDVFRIQGDRLFLDISEDVPLEFIRIPAGEFWMGSHRLDDPQASEDEMPLHKVWLSEYWISRYPVTNHQYALFLRESRSQPPAYWPGGQIPTGRDDHPVVGVSWQDALQFTQWAAGRQAAPLPKNGVALGLPSEAQWEKAARGADGRLHPWGNQAPALPLANIDYFIYNTTPVGAFSTLGDSPFGCVDMAGNVQEWTQDGYEPDFYAHSEARDPLNQDLAAVLKVIRGGSWKKEARLARCAARACQKPDSTANDLGFRCALVFHG